MTKVTINVMIRKFSFAAAMLGVFAAGSASAEYDYHQSYGYEEQLAQCLDILRPNLQLQKGEQVSYVVEEIERHGPWYEFAIVTTVTDTAGRKRLDGFEVACRSNRWINSAKLLERANDTVSYPPLVVMDTSELAASNAVARNTGE
jgi:hypothetical protein